MNNSNQTTIPAEFINPTSVRVSKDNQYLIIAIPGNRVTRKPLNYFRAIIRSVDSISS